LNKKIKELFSLSGLFLVSRVAEKGLSFFLLPIYTKYLTPEDYGVVDLLIVASMIIVTVVKSPLSSGYYRFYYSEKEHFDRKAALFSSLVAVLAQSAPFALFFIFFAGYVADILLGSAEFATIVTYFGIILLLKPIHQFAQITLKIQKNAKYLLLVNLFVLVSKAALILILIIQYHYSYMALVFGELWSAVASCILLMPVIIKNTKLSFQAGQLKSLYRFGLPLLVAPLSLYILQFSDRFILKMYYAVDEVGVYGFGYKVAQLISLFLIFPLKNALNPMIFELEKNQPEMIKFIGQSTKLFIILSVTSALILSLFARELIMIIATNSSFHRAWVIVPIICFSYVFEGLKDLSGKGIALSMKTQYWALNFLGSAILNVGLNFVLIPGMGILGAAIATAISFAFLTFLNSLFSKKLYGLTFNWMYLLKFLMIASLFYLLSVPINSLHFQSALLLKMVLVAFFILLIWKSILISYQNKMEIKKIFVKLKSLT
jgi:O-antigen/teichoic acid export membrane protein